MTDERVRGWVGWRSSRRPVDGLAREAAEEAALAELLDALLDEWGAEAVFGATRRRMRRVGAGSTATLPSDSWPLPLPSPASERRRRRGGASRSMWTSLSRAAAAASPASPQEHAAVWEGGGGGGAAGAPAPGWGPAAVGGGGGGGGAAESVRETFGCAVAAETLWEMGRDAPAPERELGPAGEMIAG